MRYEHLLRTNLLTLFRAYGEATGLGQSTISRLVSGDSRFLDRINDPGNSFTVRTYDRVAAAFSKHWPEGFPWPRAITRPPPAPFVPRKYTRSNQQNAAE